MRRTALIRSTHVNRPLTARLAALTAAALLVGGVSLPAMAEETSPNDQSVAAAVSGGRPGRPGGPRVPRRTLTPRRNPPIHRPMPPPRANLRNSRRTPRLRPPRPTPRVGRSGRRWRRSPAMSAVIRAVSPRSRPQLPSGAVRDTDAGRTIAPAGESVQCTVLSSRTTWGAESWSSPSSTPLMAPHFLAQPSSSECTPPRLGHWGRRTR